MTVRIYRSTDAGAPQLGTTIDGSLATILKACLVTGYGEKVAAGWTAPWQGTNQIALQMGAGSSGRILAIDDSVDYRYAYTFACKTFTDMANHTEKFPVNLSNLDYKNVWYKRYHSTEQYGGWVVIASSHFVYWFQPPVTDSYYMAGEFFGDYDCVEATWPYNIALTGRMTSVPNSSIQSYMYQSLFGSTIAHKHLARSWRGLLQPNVGFNVKDDGTESASGYGINPLSGKMQLSPYEMIVELAVIGKLPSVYRLQYPRNNSIEIFPFGGHEIASADSPTGKPMIAIGGSSGYWLVLEYDE
jgi:hypothetical protein